jgi:D-glycero-D-manno-heptose 1,7-bisphosphate phosphatase
VSRGVFLDRDGTLIEEVGYLDRIDRVRFFPYSVDAVRLLNRGGFVVIVTTNQAGIARGFFDEAFVEATHRSLSDTLAAGGARIDSFYFCPHHPDGAVESYRRACDCRKPRPGLLRRAAADHQLELGRSFVVGDRAHDIAAGTTVGATGVLVRTGYGDRAERSDHGAAAVTDNLMGAVSWILRQP